MEQANNTHPLTRITWKLNEEEGLLDVYGHFLSDEGKVQACKVASLALGTGYVVWGDQAYWYQGNLYAKDNRHTIDRLVDEFARDVQDVDKEADIETRIREIEQSYVIRDGVLCVMTYEPCYHISFSITSGPSIFIENIYDYDKLDDCDFRADELEQTIDAALNSEHYMDESRRQYLKDTKSESCYIEVLMPEALKMPSILNRIGQNIEKEVTHTLIHDFQFEYEELRTEKGKKLIQTVMQAVYADKELKERRYLRPSLDVERIFKQVIFDLIK